MPCSPKGVVHVVGKVAEAGLGGVDCGQLGHRSSYRGAQQASRDHRCWLQFALVRNWPGPTATAYAPRLACLSRSGVRLRVSRADACSDRLPIDSWRGNWPARGQGGPSNRDRKVLLQMREVIDQVLSRSEHVEMLPKEVDEDKQQDERVSDIVLEGAPRFRRSRRRTVDRAS